MKKNHKIAIALSIVSLIILVIIGSYLYYRNAVIEEEDKNEKEDNMMITAMEGWEIAEPIAMEWNSSAELKIVRTDNPFESGYATEWIFYCINGTPEVSGFSYNTLPPTKKYFFLRIIVYSNESYDKSIVEYASPPPFDIWNIDSPEAVEIAKEFKEYKEEKEVYPDSYLDSMYLHGYGKEGYCYWLLVWIDLDSGHMFTIELDDATGGSVPF